MKTLIQDISEQQKKSRQQKEKTKKRELEDIEIEKNRQQGYHKFVIFYVILFIL